MDTNAQILDEIRASEEYFVESESSPMVINKQDWEQLCDSNNLLQDDYVIESLCMLVKKQAFNHLVNSDCMLSPEYVSKLFDLLCYKEARYVEREKFRNEENTWFYWTIKMIDGTIICSIKNETLGALIKRIGWDLESEE